MLFYKPRDLLTGRAESCKVEAFKSHAEKPVDCFPIGLINDVSAAGLGLEFPSFFRTSQANN